MTHPLNILGTGGSVYDVLDTVEAINARAPTWQVTGFLDDSRPVADCYLGLPVLGRLRDAPLFVGHLFVNAIGSDKSFRMRPALIASTCLDSERFATLIHPGASVSAHARLGHGVCVHYGVSIGGGVVVGNHVTLCPSCIVGHDAVIEDYTILAPGAVVSGFVHVGTCCYIGARAVIRQKLVLEEGVLVGMGGVVIRDVQAETTVVGNPARQIRPREMMTLSLFQETSPVNDRQGSL